MADLSPMQQQLALLFKNSSDGFSEERDRQAKQALLAQQLQGEKDKASADVGNKLKLAQGESDIKLAGSRARLSDVLSHKNDVPAGSGLNEGEDGASFTRAPNLGTYDLKKSQMDTKQANDYSKRLEKYSDVLQAAKEIERATDRDGNGGVFTNPNAKLQSAGKVKSAVPDSVMGLGETLGVVDPGTTEERKAVARFKLAMGHALTGARMNPMMQKQIQDSLGGLASGDPQLMAKGLRGAGRILGGTIRTVQGGYSPEVRGQVHEMSGDPMDFLGAIPSEQGPPSNYNSPPAGSGNQPKPSVSGMSNQQKAPQGMSGQDPLADAIKAEKQRRQQGQ